MLKTTSNKNKSFTMHVQRPSLTKESVQSMIDNSIHGKLDKTTEVNKIYGTDANGNPIELTYGTGNVSSSIVQRMPNGDIVCGTPHNTYAATPKYYVDNAKTEAIAETENVATRVDKLEGILINYTEDDTDAYEKSVPEASAQRAILSYVGGASRVVKSKNLCTNAKEGGIALSSDGDYIDTGFSYTLPAGTYTASCSVEGDLDRMEIWVYDEMYLETTTFTLSEESRVSIYVLAYGSSAIAFPMINEGTTALPYEPYFEPYIESAPVTAIVSEGKNLIPFPYLDAMGVGYTREVNGITWTVNYDRSVTANGTATANSVLSLVSLTDKSEFEGRIAFVGLPEKGEWNKTFWMGINGTKADGSPLNGAATKTSPYTADIVKGDLLVQLAIAKGYTANNLTFYPKMYYEADTHTYDIPEAIRALDGYGEGNPDNPKEYNWVDLVNDEYHHKGNIVDNVWVALEEEDIQKISPEAIETLKGKADFMFLDVQGGGTVRCENEKKMAVPSKITFAEV